MADETTTPTLRRCSGSARFGTEAHDAPAEDFPRQPSQRDGLGRMCRPHWNAYTAGLARDAKARRAAEAALVAEPEGAEGVGTAARQRSRKVASPELGAQGDGG